MADCDCGDCDCGDCDCGDGDCDCGDGDCDCCDCGDCDCDCLTCDCCDHCCEGDCCDCSCTPLQAYLLSSICGDALECCCYCCTDAPTRTRQNPGETRTDNVVVTQPMPQPQQTDIPAPIVTQPTLQESIPFFPTAPKEDTQLGMVDGSGVDQLPPSYDEAVAGRHQNN